MEYYDLLGVAGDVTDLDLKKAYRKAAIKNHPDKGGDEEKFKMIGEAYRVLSDNNLRADYDRHGKKCVSLVWKILLLAAQLCSSLLHSYFEQEANRRSRP